MARIEGIRIKNYRVLRDITLGKLWNLQQEDPLTPMSVVIGKNGVGKSALFTAFGFLTMSDLSTLFRRGVVSERSQDSRKRRGRFFQNKSCQPHRHCEKHGERGSAFGRTMVQRLFGCKVNGCISRYWLKTSPEESTNTSSSRRCSALRLFEPDSRRYGRSATTKIPSSSCGMIRRTQGQRRHNT